MNTNQTLNTLCRVLNDHNFHLETVETVHTEHFLEGTDRTRRQHLKRVCHGLDVADLYLSHDSYPRFLWIELDLTAQPRDIVVSHTPEPFLESVLDQFRLKIVNQTEQ